VKKEWRELLSSRAWWVMLALTGPLVGVSFANAVRAYAEVSAGAGAACGIVCAPLIGIWGPTFSAYEIAAIFLLPFVAIRAVASDRQSGALMLEIQRPLPPIARMAIKAAVLLAGWIVSGAAALVAIALWTRYGGSTYAPEVAVVAAGHVLNGALTIAIALALGTIADNPSTAAIMTLAVTIGTWVVAFAAALQGGIWTTLAGYTPTAMVAMFQHALIQVNVLLATLVAVAGGIVVASVWLRQYDSTLRRWMWTSGIVAACAALAIGCAFARGSWDASESRYNSFDEPEEASLERLPLPLSIQAHLAPQDPRRSALERGPLAKLRRVVPRMNVSFVARTGTGMYEESDPQYGEVQYTYGGRTASSRMVTDEGVLETIFDLAGIVPEGESDDGFQGHPLVASATRAGWLFYGVWPAAIVGLSIFTGRRRR
jgi:hypothetical protein